MDPLLPNLAPPDFLPPDQGDATERHFAQHGYLIGRALVPPELVARAADWTRRTFFPNGVRTQDGRQQDAWRTSDAVKELACLPAVLELLRHLYRREPIPFQTLNFPVGTQQAVHSDTIHFHSLPQRFMCGVWVALERVTEQNGPLMYYPGSHRLPVLDLVDLVPEAAQISQPSPKALYPKYERAVARLIQDLDLRHQRAILEPGDVLIWAANLLHGGAPILTPGSTRFSQVTHYYFEGCRFYTPLLSAPGLGRTVFRNDVQDIRTGTIVRQPGIPVRQV